jgi:hypothetical protein
MLQLHVWLSAVALVVLNQLIVFAQDDPRFIRRDTIEPFILTDVEVIRIDVFDTTGGNSSLVGDVMNAMHTLTREKIIRYEIFVEKGDTVTQAKLDQMESNMRLLEVFADIRFEVIPEEGEEEYYYPYARLRVITQDSWSTRLSFIFSSGGGATTYGVSLREANLLGLAKNIGLGVDHSTVNDRGWGGSASFLDPNIYGTHFQLGGTVAVSRLDASATISMGRPFYSDEAPFGFNAGVGIFRGEEFFYLRGEPRNVVLTPETRLTRLAGWYAQSSQSSRGDVFRWGARLTHDRTDRDSFAIQRAFENTTGAFGGIFSMRREYRPVQGIEFSGKALVPIGGMGSVSLGYIWPHGKGTDEVFYIGAEARQAVILPGIYLFGSMQAGTGLADKESRFTIERFVGSSAIGMGPGVLAARLEQSNIWNWPRYVFQPLDNRSSLRGYTLFGLFGQNKLAVNIDYRIFPLLTVLDFRLGLVAFHDIGAVWNQGDEFARTRFHNSSGLGLRIGGRSDRMSQAVLRVDLAYNYDEQRIAQVILSTEEAFDVFGTLEYSPPGPYVP